MAELNLNQWVGKTAEITDTLTLSVCEKMAATVGIRSPANDEPLPPLWHWLFFHELTDSVGLGGDGHPIRGGFLPPVELPRRMWAGGRLRFFAPMRLGTSIQRHSCITDITQKTGKSGQLCFVTVLHRFSDDAGQMLMEEEHDIVYREAMPAATDSQSTLITQKIRDAMRPHIKASAALITGQDNNTQMITPSVSVLFRYSALTFNTHRIHYDRDYCQSVEHYAGLIFHGPLTATLMAGFAQDYLRKPLVSFEFRALAPLLDVETFTITIEAADQGVDVYARKSDGTVAMRASAEAATL